MASQASIPAVSVVMPVRGVARFIRPALESIATQSGVSCEIICIDDGASECTRGEIRKLAAADPKVEAAAKVFQSVSADAQKVKTFCEMAKVMDSAGEKADAATQAKVQSYMKQLGSDFETAWKIGGDVDENSPDGKVYTAALDDLTSKCS